MKPQTTLAIIALLLAAAPLGQAAIVLTVDVSNPAAVVFASVANAAQANATSNFTPMMMGGGMFPIFSPASGGTLDGVRLNALFAMAGTATSSGANPTTLQPGASPGSTYSAVNLSGTQIIINTQGFGSTQNFSTATNAFTGSLTSNLSQAITNGYVFPASGTSGDIFALDRPSNTQMVIGQYQVVPETSAALLGALGSLAILRRRR